MKRALYVLANVVTALIGGWWLAQFVANLPYEMPSWLDSSIRAGIHLASATQFNNTDDIESIAIILMVLACAALVGIMLVLANWLGCKLIARRRRAS